MKTYILFFISILFFFIILSGCSTILATIGTTAFITTTWNDSRTIGTQLDDTVLKIYIYRALHNHEEINKFTRIISTVYQSNVLLTGQSPSLTLSKQAIHIVMNINGVKNIYNAIRQTHPISFHTKLIDSWISNQIRLNLLTQKNSHMSHIKVISENQEVFLLGKVTNDEGYLARKIAKNVRGVKNVFPAFIYV